MHPPSSFLHASGVTATLDSRNKSPKIRHVASTMVCLFSKLASTIAEVMIHSNMSTEQTADIIRRQAVDIP